VINSVIVLHVMRVCFVNLDSVPWPRSAAVDGAVAAVRPPGRVGRRDGRARGRQRGYAAAPNMAPRHCVPRRFVVLKRELTAKMM
jgi:hypothetical protein